MAMIGCHFGSSRGLEKFEARAESRALAACSLLGLHGQAAPFAMSRGAALPARHLELHGAAMGFRAEWLGDSDVALSSAASMHLARTMRWRLLGLALRIRLAWQPDLRCRLAWRVQTLHEDALEEVCVATGTLRELLRTLPRSFAQRAVALGPNQSFDRARRGSQVAEARDARARYNSVTDLLRQVHASRGHATWRRLRGPAMLVFMHVLRRLELRLTALETPPLVLEGLRNCAVMFANVSHRLLGEAALRGIALREMEIDPFALTPRILCREMLPRNSVVAGRLLQERAETAFEDFLQGLRRLLTAGQGAEASWHPGCLSHARGARTDA